jgi:hypothetical protein
MIHKDFLLAARFSYFAFIRSCEKIIIYTFFVSKEYPMGLFSQSCPLEKSHVEIYGIPSPRKWKKEDCLICSYSEQGKCVYKQRAGNPVQMRKRGYPALAKKSLMNKVAAERTSSEKEAVKQAGYSPAQEQEYWAISREYDARWESASPDQRPEILDSLDQFKVYLESGLSPAHAYDKAKEWMLKRAEFKGK